MNIRAGFDRLSKALLGLCWAIFLITEISDFRPAEFGENLVYALVSTVGFMIFCKSVAWVYNGFASK